MRMMMGKRIKFTKKQQFEMICKEIDAAYKPSIKGGNVVTVGYSEIFANQQDFTPEERRAVLDELRDKYKCIDGYEVKEDFLPGYESYEITVNKTFSGFYKKNFTQFKVLHSLSSNKLHNELYLDGKLLKTTSAYDDSAPSDFLDTIFSHAGELITKERFGKKEIIFGKACDDLKLKKKIRTMFFIKKPNGFIFKKDYTTDDYIERPVNLEEVEQEIQKVLN